MRHLGRFATVMFGRSKTGIWASACPDWSQEQPADLRWFSGGGISREQSAKRSAVCPGVKTGSERLPQGVRQRLSPAPNVRESAADDRDAGWVDGRPGGNLVGWASSGQVERRGRADRGPMPTLDGELKPARRTDQTPGTGDKMTLPP